MKSIISCILLAFVCISANAQIWQPSSGHMQIPIWPEGKMPDALLTPKKEYITTISHPLIHIFQKVRRLAG